MESKTREYYEHIGARIAASALKIALENPEAVARYLEKTGVHKNWGVYAHKSTLKNSRRAR